MSNVKDLRGMKFGHLKVLMLKDVIKHIAHWECECDCGNSVVRSSSYLKSNSSVASCGCKVVRGNFTHGESKTPLYAAWAGMKNRCRPNGQYAKRGITVCSEWYDFGVFKRDMGPTFVKGLSLDREDNTKGYFKENCRWATTAEQQAHSSRTLRFEYEGRTLTIREASEMTGLKMDTIRYRIKSGWSPSDIISRRPSDPASMMQPLSHE